MIESGRLEQFEPGVLTLLVGPTASGKTSVLEGLVKQFPDIKPVITTTSRPRGPTEVNGREYNFMHPLLFHVFSRLGGFLETGPYGGYWYGTRKKDITPVLHNQDLAWIVAMYRGLEIGDYYRRSYSPRIAQALQDRTLLILIGTPTLFDLRNRFRERKRRGDFINRTRADWEIWQRNIDNFPHVVINHEEKLDQTISTVAALIEERRKRIQSLI